MVYAIGFAALGSKKTNLKPVPVFYQQYGVEALEHDDEALEARLIAKTRSQEVLEEAMTLYQFEKECAQVPGSSSQTTRDSFQGLCKLPDLYSSPKTLLWTAIGNMMAVMVCDADENLPMARLQLTALVDFAMSRCKGLETDPMQLATALDQLEAYCAKHFPSGLLQFENTKLASQQTKEALAALKT
eukprot:m.131088 g.131088  ORF g.131088 m.131088 type:complete len:187 (+) comp15899_c0_seq1:39-599(+)